MMKEKKNMTHNRFRNSIRKEEKIVSEEIKKEKEGIKWFLKSHTFKIILVTIIFMGLIGGLLYYNYTLKRVYIEKSEISAPIISLSSLNTGVLDNVFVKEGEFIPKDTVVADVNGNEVKSKIAGMVIYILNTPGQIVNAQTPIVKMIDPNELRVIGHIPEDKGLNEIRVGQKAIFTVDAFSSKKYEGVVESISPTSTESGILFSISDKRPEKEFDIKVRFNIEDYPELRNGMSAKLWIYK